MTPTAAIANPQRRNVTVLALAQALFMSVQGMGAIANPLAGYMLLGRRREVAGDGAGVPHAARHHGRHRSSLAADGRHRPPRRLHIRGAARSSGRCGGMRGPLPAELPAAVRRGAVPGHAGGILLVFPPGRGRRLRARPQGQGDLAGHGGRRAGGLPWTAGRQVVGRPAGAGDVRRRLSGHGRFLGCGAAADPAPAHPGAHHGRARRRRTADDGNRAPAGLPRRARLLGAGLRGDDAHHVGDAARHARLRLRLRRQRHRHPDAHRRHVPALVLHRPPDRALRRADGDRRRCAVRARRRVRQPDRPRARPLSPSPTC